MRELALHACDDEIARASLWRCEERVLGASRALQRVGDLVLRREDRGVAEIELGEHQRVACSVPLRDLRELRGLFTPNEVVGKLEQVDGDPGLEQGILDEREDFIQLRPCEIKRFEVFETSRPQDSTLKCLTPAR